MKHKSYEKTLAEYLSTIADGIHKECGERPHSLWLEELDETSKHYQTTDSSLLKQSIDKLMGKMEVISTNIINLNKFKNQT